VGSFEHINGPSGSIKGREFLDKLTDSFSRRTVLHGVGWLVGWLEDIQTLQMFSFSFASLVGLDVIY